MNHLLNIKYMKNYIIIILLLFCLFELLEHPEIAKVSSGYSTNLWLNNIVPTLFPFFIISSLLISYGFSEIIGSILYPFFYKLFKISKSSSIIIILSLFSGIPGNAKYIVDLYNEKMIDENEGTKLLCFTFFSNPLFILGALSTNMIKDNEIGIIILICHYLPNLFIGLFLRKHYINKSNNYSKRISNNNLGKLITNSLITSINTLLLVLGVITLFSLLINIVTTNFNINKTLISSILEMTQGLNLLANTNLSFEIKVLFSTMIISFGGFSSHLQIIGIISNTNIKYKPFFISRIFHAVLSALFIILYFYLF